MNIRRVILWAALIFAAASAFSQTAPVNDHFTNATILSGASVTFSGSLSNATGESNEPGFLIYSAPASIWWSWTAPTSAPVIITLSRDRSAPNFLDSWFEVFGGASLGSLSRIDYNSFDFPAGRYVKFAAVAGSTYHFRATGNWPGTLTLQLTISPAPLIITPPASRTNSLYSSAMFYVVAGGIPAPSYQWRFNGSLIPGETAPVLIVYNTLTNIAGNYSVIARNSGGIMESAPATLSIRDTNPIPFIEALPRVNPTPFAFNLHGEPGRWYKFDLKVDDKDWTDNLWFGLCTNIVTRFSVSASNGTIVLARASLQGSTEACIAQLDAYGAAQCLFAIEHRLSSRGGSTFSDLFPYLNGPQIRYCPLGGTYFMGGSLTNPAGCSCQQLAGHKFSGY